MFEKRKQLKYQSIIKDLISLPDSAEKISKLLETLSAYYKFCYQNKLDSALPFNEQLKGLFIIPSEPSIFNDFPNLERIVNDLEEAIKINQDEGLITGITEEEAEILLSYSITNARKILTKGYDIKKDSLEGVCGYAQLLTLYPFYQIGVPVTINNVTSFPFAEKLGHAFGSVTLPIINFNGEVSNESFLIDASYRQFFTIYGNHIGRYFLDDTPDSGYFVIQTEEGKKFAADLLSKGFVPLTLENAKMYGESFSLSASKLDSDTFDKIRSISASEYLKSITDCSLKFDYTEAEISAEIAENNILFPTDKLKK